MESSSIFKNLTQKENPLTRQVGGSHYKDNAIQPIDYIQSNEMGFCEGNIVKYITRYAKKGGVEDIDKVIHYAEILKYFVESKQNER